MHNKEDKILESLSGMQKAQAPDFFYTHLLGRMQQEMVPEPKPFILLRPVFAGAVLFLALVINIFSIIRFNKAPGGQALGETTQPVSLQSFADAYNLNSSSVYE